MSRYIKADYLKAIMKNDRLLQGNCEYELWKQQVNKYVDSLPSIEVNSDENCDTCKYGVRGCGDCHNCALNYPNRYEPYKTEREGV